MKERPYVLTIAGLDPSGGAGLMADIKTIEAIKCYGLSVCTANTVQTDTSFNACHWMPPELIKSQLSVLIERFSVECIKIGIIENQEVLNEVIETIHKSRPETKIVLDPVLKSSTRFDFHPEHPRNTGRFIWGILDSIYLLTPNHDEIQMLDPGLSLKETIACLTSKTNLLLKSGHREEARGEDILYSRQGGKTIISPAPFPCFEKHGSGCILSSAIASYLALGDTLKEACIKGKRYTEKVLASNQTLLGHHG